MSNRELPLTFVSLSIESESSNLTPVAYPSDTEVSDSPANTRELARRLPTTMIDSAKVHIPDAEVDPTYDTLMREVLAGRRLLGHSRFELNRIRAHWEEGTSIRYGTSEPESVATVTRWIRRGQRPAPWVYYDENSGEFVCPDDANSLRAYAQLGFEVIPVAIIDPTPAQLAHSCITFRAIRLIRGHLQPLYYFEGVMLPESPKALVLT